MELIGFVSVVMGAGSVGKEGGRKREGSNNIKVDGEGSTTVQKKKIGAKSSQDYNRTIVVP